MPQTTTPMLITPEYLALNQELHARVPRYGTSGHKWARWVRALSAKCGCKTVLDYGCGKGTLGTSLKGSGLDVREYDPAVEGKTDRPERADLVVCTDVLEHVEEECIVQVLDDIMSLADKAVLLSICCKVGERTLADGRPAHILVRSQEWWGDMLSGYGRFKPIEGEDYEYNAVMRR